MRLIKDYNELNKFFVFFENYIKDLNLSSNIKSNFLQNEFRCYLGCLLIGEKFSNIQKYISNRYFMEATNCSEIIQIKSFNDMNFSKLISSIFPNLFDVTNDSPEKINQLFLNEIFDKYKSTKVDTNFPVEKFWNEETKEFFDKNGYCIFKNVFSKNDVEKYKEVIYQIAAKEKKSSAAYFYGFNNSLQRVYNLINKTKEFDYLVNNPLITSIMDDLFDRDTLHQKYVMASWHGNIINPGGAAQVVHVDSAVPEPLPEWIIRANVNYIVEDYTIENGATRCLPGSHLFQKKPNPKEIDKYKDKFIDLVAPAGSVVIWHGHLWHCSGQNQSDKPRVALLGCYAATHLLEMCLEEYHPLIITNSRKYEMEGDLKKLFSLEHGIRPGSEFL